MRIMTKWMVLKRNMNSLNKSLSTGLKITKTIVVLFPGLPLVAVVVDDETQTIVSLQPEIRRQMGLRPTEFTQLGYHHRMSGSAETETVWVPNSMTVHDAYDLIIQQTSAPDLNALALVGDIGVVAPPRIGASAARNPKADGPLTYGVYLVGLSPPREWICRDRDHLGAKQHDGARRLRLQFLC